MPENVCQQDNIQSDFQFIKFEQRILKISKILAAYFGKTFRPLPPLNLTKFIIFEYEIA